MANQQIKCNVRSCKYNDESLYCSLDDIVVGNTEIEAHEKEETECVSFEVK